MTPSGGVGPEAGRTAVAVLRGDEHPGEDQQGEIPGVVQQCSTNLLSISMFKKRILKI